MPDMNKTKTSYVARPLTSWGVRVPLTFAAGSGAVAGVGTGHSSLQPSEVLGVQLVRTCHGQPLSQQSQH